MDSPVFKNKWVATRSYAYIRNIIFISIRYIYLFNISNILDVVVLSLIPIKPPSTANVYNPAR